MSNQDFTFPEGFLWGTATAAHQVEGQNDNNTWSAWEKLPGKIHKGERAGLACDWWGGRWQEDMDRAAAGHQNTHRFSVEWSRVEVGPDQWDDEALAFYLERALGMVQRGLKPMITLHHFTDPLWLAEKGGWEWDEAPRHFAAFTRRVVEALKDTTNLWVTINEPNGYPFFQYLFGNFPPGRTDFGACFKAMVNLMRAHAAAYHVLHEVQPQAQAGFAYSHRPFRAARWWHPLDWAIFLFADRHFNEAFIDPVVSGRMRFLMRRASIPESVGTQDFIGLNYYSVDDMFFSLNPKRMWIDRRFPKGAELSETGFIANLPKGLYRSMDWADRYKLPVYITENGVEDCRDTLRPKYIIEHLYQVWRAIQAGIPVKGYYYWSLTDNFEWERGWKQGFGLYGLDPLTQ